jgi:hypothetical protein
MFAACVEGVQKAEVQYRTSWGSIRGRWRCRGADMVSPMWVAEGRLEKGEAILGLGAVHLEAKTRSFSP